MSTSLVMFSGKGAKGQARRFYGPSSSTFSLMIGVWLFFEPPHQAGLLRQEAAFQTDVFLASYG